MNTILSALAWVVLAIWPFHKKPVVPPPEVSILIQSHVPYPDDYCGHTDDGFFFLGVDGMVGLSKASCDDAYQDWRNTTRKIFPPSHKI